MTQSYNLSQLANNLNTAGQLDTTDGLAGAVPPANGGTGLASYAVGDLLYASGATALAKLPDIATGNALISGGVGAAPAYGKIGLTTHVSGTLPVTSGGTGLATITSNALLVGAGTGNVATIAPGTNGQALVSNGTAWVAGAIVAAQTQYALFASSGSWTCPSNVTRVKATVIGGGGGAAYSGVDVQDGGAGGYGANYYTVVPGTVYTVTVGAGGNGFGTGGSAGGTTSFGAFISATGGSYGASRSNGACANSLFNTTANTIVNFGSRAPFLGNVQNNTILGAATAWSAGLGYVPGSYGSANANACGIGGGCFLEYVG